ncbi:hypothetical protein CIB95_06870 [Lottiidibacillus patelloidae]|uniref:Lipocalin-like domain-containing protein n=1 Tax=Lottiidibacillus patelloidae TaxID=2670334 RepID=A0A263BTW3_9BACI|nr:hypothetical protein [Lottiidibacillus patelloidae]OZM57183.1 hypothetical protein CIB95_06870 [Lottiidibacillus patelloidae]
MKKIIFYSLMLVVIATLGACNGKEENFDSKVLGEWQTSSFTLNEKDYDENANEAFSDGVKIGLLQMFFKEGEAITFDSKGNATFHGIKLNYIIEKNNLLTLTSEQLVDMKLTFKLEEKGNNLLFKHELGTAILTSAK